MEDFIDLLSKINEEFLKDKDNFNNISKNVMEYELKQVNVKTNVEYKCLMELPDYLLTFKDDYLKTLGAYNYDLLAEFLINGFSFVNNKAINNDMNEYLKTRYMNLYNLISASIYLKKIFSHLITYIKKYYNKNFLHQISLYNNQQLNGKIDHFLFHSANSSIVYSKRDNSIDEIINNYLEYEMSENDKIGSIIDTYEYQNTIINQYRFVIKELDGFINAKIDCNEFDKCELIFYQNIAILFKEFMELRICKLKMPTINNFIMTSSESNIKNRNK